MTRLEIQRLFGGCLACAALAATACSGQPKATNVESLEQMRDGSESSEAQTAASLGVPENGRRANVDDDASTSDELPVLIVRKVDEAPVLDGNLSDAVWKVAERTGPFVEIIEGEPVRFSTVAGAVYTDRAVYFGFEVYDRDIRVRATQRDDRLWEEDCVIVYLNPDGDDGTYWELLISPGDGEDGTPPIFDAYFDAPRQPRWESARDADISGLRVGLARNGTLNSADGHADDLMYTLEVEIPFDSLEPVADETSPSGPMAGTQWRVNFVRVDYEDTDDAPQRTQHSAWSPPGTDFHDLETFGTLTFGEPEDGR